MCIIRTFIHIIAFLHQSNYAIFVEFLVTVFNTPTNPVGLVEASAELAEAPFMKHKTPKIVNTQAINRFFALAKTSTKDSNLLATVFNSLCKSVIRSTTVCYEF